LAHLDNVHNVSRRQHQRNCLGDRHDNGNDGNGHQWHAHADHALQQAAQKKSHRDDHANQRVDSFKNSLEHAASWGWAGIVRRRSGR
jgi:hypothetical protein